MRIEILWKEWLNRSQDERKRLAALCSTSWETLRNMVYGAYVINPQRAVIIEKEWGISRRELRPTDWGDIWPELIDAEHPWPPVAELTQESA